MSTLRKEFDCSTKDIKLCTSHGWGLDWNLLGLSCPVILKSICFLRDLFTAQKFIFTCPGGCINLIPADFKSKISPWHIKFDVLNPRGQLGVSVQVAEARSCLHVIIGIQILRQKLETFCTSVLQVYMKKCW